MINESENPWITLASKTVYDNSWIHVSEHDVINPGGGKGIYGKVHFKNLAIGIVALDEEDNTYLVGQYRYPIGQYSWEIPEGGGKIGADPLESAKRELQEETGIIASNWKEIQRIHLSNSVSDEFGILYLAQELNFGESAPEETEALQVRKVPFKTALKMVLDGSITDSLSVAAILRVHIMKTQSGENE